MTKQSYIGIVAAIIVLFALFAFISRHPAGTGDDSADSPSQTQNTPPPLPQLNATTINNNWRSLISLANAPANGNPNAEYTMIEIGDFQCPQCGRSRPDVEKLLADSNGKLKLYFVNFPLPMHAHARFAATASLAAANQHQFWPMYDLLYSHQDELIPSEIQYYTQKQIPSINIAKFESDLTSADIADKIDHQVQLLNALQVESTPTFIVRRTAGGTPVWFIGSKDTPTSKGLGDLIAAPPWEKN